MNKFLTKDDRKFLMTELEECLIDMGYIEEYRKEILLDMFSADNVSFYDNMVDWMPDCMDNLRYYHDCLRRRGLTVAVL